MIDVLTAELRAPITEETAELYVGGTVFKTGPPTRVGVELEWLVHDAVRPDDPVHPPRLTEALSARFDPPLAGSLTTEPGGQLELSSPPAPLTQCLDGTAADLARLRDRLATAGLTLTGLGLDSRPPVLCTTLPRYLAMERHFAARGPEGRAMMCSTASVQVCLDAGTDDAEVAERWHALHAWLPVLTGLFANSPSAGWRCTRTAIWSAIDPTRTAAPTGPDPRAAYARWALDAELLAVRREGGSWTAPDGVTFRGWLRGAAPQLPAPTGADLDYHLTTLFPPVRGQGHLELRAIDAQPGDGWRVVAALVAALLDDPVARATATAAATDALDALAATSGRAGGEATALTVAARDAMTDPSLRRAALCFIETAAGALTRAGAAELAREVEGFGERYPARSRCPADDRPIAPEEGA
ncbi:MAG TPA: glutamate-cysteine ligase family protein [Mycobacteriales bacterium]|nr:glutamate-cysteine ligase family protein [Mycobacteriales bacterium]